MNNGLFDNGYIRTGTVVPEVFIGDIGKNCVEIIEYTKKAMEKNIDLLVFPELSLTGYTSQDLFLNSDYIKKTIGGIKFIQEKLAEYCADKRDILIAVGAPIRKDNQLFNCAVWISAKNGILGVVPKTHIPNYGEFYEKRWFSSATQKTNSVINLFGKEYPLIKLSNNSDKEVVIGTEICEDLWVAVPPSSYHVLNGANIIVNLSASNETVGKSGYRTELVKQQAARGICGYVYVSAGSTESTSDTIFSGHSIISENGEVVVNSRVENEILYADLDVEKLIHERTRVNSFMENRAPAEYKTVELYWENRSSIFELKRSVKQNPFLHNEETMKEIINIQAKGLEIRLKKTGIKNVVLGISGGLDSTLALLVCRRAFENLGLDLKGIHGITMPCFGTTSRTYNNSLNLMKKLGISYKDISIKKSVTQHFEDIGHPEDVYDVTYENCQARERTQVLMDYSNKVNGLVIGTGDLSEIFLGWMTYNGDHMSMYAVNSGVPKTIVRRLVEIIKQDFDTETEEILTDIVNTEISPELLPPGKNGEIVQSTEKTIGNYLLHDFFIFHFFRNGFGIEKMFYLAEIAFKGVFSTEDIVNTLEIFTKRVFRNQFKRNCLPDGVKIGSIAVSPRADLRLASEIEISMWMNEVEKVKRYAEGESNSN